MLRASKKVQFPSTEMAASSSTRSWKFFLEAQKEMSWKTSSLRERPLHSFLWVKKKPS